jgi:hypothetical protein
MVGGTVQRVETEPVVRLVEESVFVVGGAGGEAGPTDWHRLPPSLNRSARRAVSAGV